MFYFIWVLRSRIDGSYCKYIFNFIRNCQTILQSSYTIVHPQQLLHILSSKVFF